MRMNGPLNFFAHLLQQMTSHADPGLAATECLGNLRRAHVMHGQQLDGEFGLFEKVQASLFAKPHQRDDSHRFVFAQRDVGHAFDTQLFGAALAFKAVEQDTFPRRVHALQRLLDAAIGDRRPEARFGSVVPHAVALIAEIQSRSFHTFTHAIPPKGDVR
jgi:hypothetical protein